MFGKNQSLFPNQTSAFHYSEISVHPYFYPVRCILVLIFILGMLFNSLSITSILSSKKYTTINMLILNLAIADLTYMISVPLYTLTIFSKSWNLGKLGCRVFFMTDFIGMIVSVLTVTALSIERFFDVADTKKRFDKFSNQFKLLIITIYILLTWLFAILYPLPMILSIDVDTNNHTSQINCITRWDENKLILFFFTKFILIFLIPFSIIAFSSIKLLLFLNRWAQNSNKSKSTQKAHNKKRDTEVKILKPKDSYQNKEVCLSNLEDISYSDSCSMKMHSITSININDELINYDLNSQMTSCKQVAITHDDQIILEVKTKQSINCYRYCIKCLNVTFMCRKFNIFVCGSCTKKSKSNNYISSIRNKASRLVLFIVLLFLIQWIPLWIFHLFNEISSIHYNYIHLISIIVTVLSYSNSVTNPIIYMLLTYKFKEYTKNGVFRYFYIKKKTQKL